MRTVICRELTGPDGLVVEERPSVDLPETSVRVSVRAAGLNYVDALFTQGRYQIRPPLPFTPGSELAGEIVEVGGSVKGWRPGDRICASIGLGAFCDEIVLAPSQLIRMPDALGYGQAATMIQSYATAWFTLTRRVPVTAGQSVVVLGAAGGVGLAAIDVARAKGARVIAVASSEEKLALCRHRGADEVINYSDDDLKARIRELTDGGADIVIDPVGGPHTEAALRGLGNFGRLAVIGFAAGDIPSVPTNQVLLRNRSIMGIDWGAWAMTFPDENRVLLDEVMSAVVDGTLDPVEPVAYPLELAAKALDDLLGRRVTGKAALVP